MSALVLIPFAAFLVISLRYYFNNGRILGAIGFVGALYVVMAAVAVLLRFLESDQAARPLSIVAVTYLCFCITLPLLAIGKFKDKNFNSIVIPSVQSFRILEYTTIVGSICALVFFSYFALQGLSGNAGDNRLNLDYTQQVLGSYGAVNTVLSLFAGMFGLNILFAILNLIDGFGYPRASKVRASLHMLGSASYVAYIFAYVGRDGLVLWSMTFIFLFLLLRQFIRRPYRARVKRVATMIVAVALPLFAVITASRFANSESGVLLSLLQYAGIQVQQFNDQFLANANPQMGRLNFSLVYRLLFGEKFYFERADWYRLYTEVGVLPWTFSTFVGSFVQDFGRLGGVVSVLLLTLFCYLSFRGRAGGHIGISSLVAMVFFAQVLMFGVFYFRQGLANTQIVAFLVCILVLSLRGSGPPRVLAKLPS